MLSSVSRSGADYAGCDTYKKAAAGDLSGPSEARDKSSVLLASSELSGRERLREARIPAFSTSIRKSNPALPDVD